MVLDEKMLISYRSLVFLVLTQICQKGCVWAALGGVRWVHASICPELCFFCFAVPRYTLII